jgi:multidrug efflux pump subunit AcrB
MQEGNNIVKFGNEVETILETFKQNIPKDIHVKTIVNQPELVNHNVSHFISEFFLAILSVVVVVILLLPIRVASVAAMAIPMTVAVTFALLELLGIELHQVSLAALIVVLGMVVDDAIVVADNYVELLDHGVDRWNAAWRSASDLVVPILAATVTIIASFFPMVLLTGSVGEFIRALPITVAISLAASFIVAMVLTPFLCFVFIKKGLASGSDKKRLKDRILDGMQKGYNALLSFCVARPKTTVSLSLVTILFAGGLYLFGVKQKFFPAAERNQFVVELWMPTGTRLESTEKAVRKLEKLIRKDSRVESYATFIGTSAPRFYYNFSPEVPVPNYAQILINTHDVEETESLSKALKKQVENAVPEGSPQVKLMQQGQPLKASVEVRIIGEDQAVLKEIGVQIETVLKETAGSAHVKNDFREDYYGIGVQLTDEADRLGFTTESVSKTVYAGFTGAVVSTMYEGNDPVDIVVRLDSASRKNFTDLGNLYVTSPVTNVHIPLRQIAELKPEWQTGKIMHRNGVRTLTVQSETTDDVLPSELLKKVQPEIEKIALPNGYKIEYGGEYANKKETFSQMMAVLGISLLLIYLVLLLQFRNLKESLIVMLTIPLSLFGALFGLWVTGNNFGFTAFVGLISLSGVVVRNAIILVDYTNELLREGYDISTAAIESGKRRLRPIFLTAIAAAIGVIPMILSGSPMWSPLASVLAFGVIWSMLMALITVPVIYMNWVKPKDKKLLNEKEE